MPRDFDGYLGKLTQEEVYELMLAAYPLLTEEDQYKFLDAALSDEQKGELMESWKDK